MDHDHKLEEKYEGLMPDAIIFAFNAHSGQYRKDYPMQYIIHPLRVSEFLLKNFSSHPEISSMRIAAVLHDTVEDTWVTENDVEEKFGKKISSLVRELTHPDIADKKEMHEKYIRSLRESSDESKIIKLADIFDNVVLSTDDTKKWRHFIKSCKELLESLELREKNKTYENLKSELLNILEEKLRQHE